MSSEDPTIVAPGATRELDAPAARALALKRRASWVAALAAQHWLFLLLLAAGAALRALTFFAYQPVLLNSTEYLANSERLWPGRVHPFGYPLFVRILPLDPGLWIVALVQHLLGLGVAILLYALLLRLGVRRWLAALATGAVLLDAYQLSIEQYLTPEALFELLLVGGCALLLWRRPLGTAFAGLAGLLFAGAALTRTIGVLVVVPALLAVLFLRAGWPRVLALLALFALPLAAYAGWYHSVHGQYALTGSEGRFLYARVAPFVDCRAFSKPSYEEVLCPKEPVGQRLPVNELLWSPMFSPIARLQPPPGTTTDEVASDFAKRAIIHQPLAYARAVGADALRAFAPTRTTVPGEFGTPPWQFHLGYPIFFRGSVCSPEATREIVDSLRIVGQPVAASRETGCGRKREKTDRAIRVRGDERYVDRSLTSFLSKYQRIGYAPGPLLALGLLLALVAAAGVGRARRSGLRSAAFLFSGVAVAVCLGSVVATVFSWRYQIPQLVLLPPALALGLTALIGNRRPSDSPVGPSPPADT